MTRHWRHAPCGVWQCGVNVGQNFMLTPHFVPASFFIRAIFLRAMLRMVLMWGDQVSFLSNFTPRYDGVSCWWISCPLICRMNTSLLGDKEKQMASVLVLLIITNNSFAQSEMRFIASRILMAAVVTCSGLVHNTRLSACSARGMWEDSWSQMSSMKIMRRVGKMTPPCGTPDFHWRVDLPIKPDSCWSLEQVALDPWVHVAADSLP